MWAIQIHNTHPAPNAEKHHNNYCGASEWRQRKSLKLIWAGTVQPHIQLLLMWIVTSPLTVQQANAYFQIKGTIKFQYDKRWRSLCRLHCQDTRSFGNYVVYVPAHFAEHDTELLYRLMEQNSFATLVTCQEQRPFASHLPFLLDTSQGQQGTLRAHMARANPQWQDFANEQEVLAIFQGAHAYISPSWYEAPVSVPTWNYAAVHVYGVPRLIDEQSLYTMLREMVAMYEGGFASPWKFDLPGEYVEKMLKAVVGFEIEISRIEGKFKLSQNRSVSDRQGVVEALRLSGTPEGLQIAEWMDKALNT